MVIELEWMTGDRELKNLRCAARTFHLSGVGVENTDAPGHRAGAAPALNPASPNVIADRLYLQRGFIGVVVR